MDAELEQALRDVSARDFEEEGLLRDLVVTRAARAAAQQRIARLVSAREGAALSPAQWREFFGGRSDEVARALAAASLNGPVDEAEPLAPVFLYVWEDVFKDHSCGMAVAIAPNKGDAIIALNLGSPGWEAELCRAQPQVIPLSPHPGAQGWYVSGGG